MPTAAGSPSSSTTVTTTSTAVDVTENPVSNRNEGGGGAPAASATQSWWESISRARSRILSLASVLSSPDLASLADSDRPARSLLDSPVAYAALSTALSAPSSGSGDDALCHWLYDTFQSSDPDLRLVGLSFLLLAGHYLSGVVSSSAANPPSLAGFEAVLLALYAAEVKARAGKPVLVSVPDLSLPSLYHTPRPSAPSRQPPSAAAAPPPRPSVGILSPPLEPQIAVKSTKRACIVAVALDSYYKKISFMPSRSKIDLCEFVAAWAGQDCPCRFELDDDDLNRSSLCSSSPSSSSSSPQVRIFFEDNGGIWRCRGDEEISDPGGS
ncbi:Hyccin [Musa troglodytarum]|uniref:Hyccin n=1 Tax=Musa troglodytarum TaxID=320322 RepID=A0A9E7G839_9LILI|nr:Hyccin [Musa troglodytarum]